MPADLLYFPAVSGYFGVVLKIRSLWEQAGGATIQSCREGELHMPQFVIEREVPGISTWTEAQIREALLKSREALKHLGPEIRWVHSFVTDDKIYCIYFAPDEEMIKEHGRIAGAPVNRVAAVRRMLDPSSYSES